MFAHVLTALLKHDFYMMHHISTAYLFNPAAGQVVAFSPSVNSAVISIFVPNLGINISVVNFCTCLFLKINFPK